MYKVIVERPRGGASWAPRVKSRHDPVPDRTFVGMRRAAKEQTAHTKYFNDHLGPLRRYLWKQRGRPWSQVYSEICATLDPRHTVKQHVLEHIQDFIIVRVSISRDGSWLGHGCYGWARPLETCHHGLYVDPVDGKVKETAAYRRSLGLPERRNWRNNRPVDKQRVILDDKTELRRIRGIWYRVEFEAYPDAARKARALDALTCERVWPGNRHAAMKRQLSGAELKQHGLRNRGNS